MKLGFGAATWLRVPGLAGLNKMLDDCSLIGFDGLEMSHPAVFDAFYANPKYYMKLFAIHDLGLSSFYTTLDFDDDWNYQASVRKAKQVYELVSEMGSGHVLLDQAYHTRSRVPGSMRELPKNPKDYVKRMADTTNELARFGKSEYGLATSWHQHWGSALMVEDNLHMFLEYTDPDLVNFCMDTAQLYVSGIDPVKIATLYANRMVYVHFKDAAIKSRARAEIWPGGPPFPTDDGCYLVNSKAQIIELGRGDIDFPRITRILRDANFDGWIVDDHDITPYAPADAAKACLDYLNGALDIWGERQIRLKEE